MKDVVNSKEMQRVVATREMQPYNRPTRAMYIGAPGKVGYLRLGFELDKDGKSIMRDLQRMAPLIVQQELYCDEGMPAMPVVYILSSGGPNVDGDRYEQEIVMRRGAIAHVTTGAATKIAEMNDNFSALCQQLTLEEDSYLEFMPEPTIPCRTARYVTRTDITCHASATLFYSEIFACGRKHRDEPEIFAYDILSVTCDARRPDGERLFREKFVIEPGKQSPEMLGIMGRYHMFANVIVLTPPDKAEEIYNATEVGFKDGGDIAIGITRLPNHAGLLLKVMGMETEPVKKIVREFASTVRMTVKGHPLLPDFPWR
ncbi:urease accessory protein UreD [uncultured Muribaculum sp.]|uniref:urease accessory protein UreD n=1 Tax=uncultured Muribaculum sp. TaxID=1918613 RepID=UPI0025F68991|nr:urease accessory protein UreD [uncultured Muribaculum sp.]